MLGFRVLRESGVPNIDTLDIEIMDGDASKPLCSFSWQCNTDGEDRDWYAFQFRIECRDLPGLKEAAALLRRILRSLDKEPGPAVIVGKLERLSIWQVVYDSRVHGLVYVDEVAPPEYKLYLEQVKGERYPHVSCLAQNSEEAQKLIAVKLAEGGYDDILVRWIEGGKQLRCATERHPDVTPAMEIIGEVQNEVVD